MSILRFVNEKPIWIQLIVFFLLVIASFLVFTVLGFVFVGVFYGINPITSPYYLSDYQNPEVIDILRIIQLFNSIGAFVLPPILFWGLSKPKENPLANNPIRPSLFYMAFLLMVFALPFINWMAYLNEQIHLPDAFAELEKWMRDTEEAAKELTEALLKMDTPTRFIMNMIVIGVIPAVGEEFFFRGTVQPLIQKKTKNYHVAIWITAFLFSALHGQFLGFFPRMFLGAIFGYLFVWSGNIWVPVIGHLANNGLAVLASYYIQLGELNPDIENLGRDEVNFSLFSFLLMGGFIFLFYRTAKME